MTPREAERRIERLEMEVDELKEQVAFLRAEQGLVEDAEKVERLTRALTLRPFVAKLLLRLYVVKGRILSRQSLEETIAPIAPYSPDSNMINVAVCHARRAIGKDGIETHSAIGYAITPAGMERVAAALDGVSAVSSSLIAEARDVA